MHLAVFKYRMVDTVLNIITMSSTTAAYKNANTRTTRYKRYFDKNCNFL